MPSPHCCEGPESLLSQPMEGATVGSLGRGDGELTLRSDSTFLKRESLRSDHRHHLYVIMEVAQIVLEVHANSIMMMVCSAY